MKIEEAIVYCLASSGRIELIKTGLRSQYKEGEGVGDLLKALLDAV